MTGRGVQDDSTQAASGEAGTATEPSEVARVDNEASVVAPGAEIGTSDQQKPVIGEEPLPEGHGPLGKEAPSRVHQFSSHLQRSAGPWHRTGFGGEGSEDEHHIPTVEQYRNPALSSPHWTEPLHGQESGAEARRLGMTGGPTKSAIV